MYFYNIANITNCFKTIKTCFVDLNETKLLILNIYCWKLYCVQQLLIGKNYFEINQSMVIKLINYVDLYSLPMENKEWNLGQPVTFLCNIRLKVTLFWLFSSKIWQIRSITQTDIYNKVYVYTFFMLTTGFRDVLHIRPIRFWRFTIVKCVTG